VKETIMFRVMALALLLAGSGSAAFAADVKPPEKEPAAGSVPVDPKQVVCKRVASDDQNMLPGPKVCHTRAEWAEIEKNGQPASTGH
jgi:hypothetical protein